MRGEEEKVLLNFKRFFFFNFLRSVGVHGNLREAALGLRPLGLSFAMWLGLVVAPRSSLDRLPS